MVREVFYAPALQARVPALVYHRCTACGSLWAADARREPYVLERAYAALPPDYWTGLTADTRLYRRIEALLARHAPGRTVCDVGCGAGHFLEWLAPRWDTIGIEPGRAAVARTRACGLRAVQGTAATLVADTSRGADAPICDAVTALDVLEHLVEPRRELAAMARLLRPGGVLVLYTGDAGRWTARAAGGLWEYLHCVGHVSVFSRRGLNRLLTDLGLEVLEARPADHAYRTAWPRWLLELRANRRRQRQGLPYRRMRYCRDHQCVVARRPAHWPGLRTNADGGAEDVSCACS